MCKAMKKLLIFDAYGTLISTGTGSVQAAEKILALQERAIDAKAFYADWKKVHRVHLDECNVGEFLLERDVFVKDLKVLYEKYDIKRSHETDVQIMLDSLVGRTVFPEVLTVLESLRKKYQVVIGSTTDTVPLLSNMRQNGLVLDVVYTSEMIGKYKPAAEFYQYILQKERCKAEDAVFIGDSLVDDVAGPQKLGMDTVLVDRKNKYDVSEGVTPNYVVSGMDEIVGIEF